MVKHFLAYWVQTLKITPETLGQPQNESEYRKCPCDLSLEHKTRLLFRTPLHLEV